MDASLYNAIASVPPGPYAIAVSGGADSVGLLRLLCPRPDLSLHIVHLDHETRADQSTADAQFVSDLATTLKLPFTIKRISELNLRADRSRNPSAHFRTARLHLFRTVVKDHALQGVLLAHHADDQAETVFQRLLRGSGPTGLTGIRPQTTVAGLTLLRPLLAIHRQQIRTHLVEINQPWREDASNASSKYTRNRLRKALTCRPDLTRALSGAADAFANLRSWIRSAAPVLAPAFDVGPLANAPELLARESSRRWLIDRGSPPGDLSPQVLDRLILMASDAASPARTEFPGRILAKRKAGRIFV